MRSPSRSSKHPIISPIRFGIAIALATAAVRAPAAPCCGGASVLPSLITGDDRAMLSASLSRGEVIGDAPAHGTPIFRAASDTERTETLKLDGAWLVDDRWQLAGSLPLIRRSRETRRQSAQSAGIGDVNLSTSFEIVPERTYSAWRPRGFAFLQLTLPTSPSIYSARERYLIDARGRGLLIPSIGTAWVKIFGDWDALATGELHHALPTETRRPGWGASASLAVGLSPAAGPLRIGLSIAPIWDDAMKVRASPRSAAFESAPQLVWNTGAQISWAFADVWSTTLAYLDQTLLGPVNNVSLSRVASWSLQRRWEL